MRGTGFFIDDNGTFITADHVVSKRPPHSKLIYHGSIPHRVIPKPLEIKVFYNDAIKDICIGQIKDKFPKKVEFADINPKIGTSICLSGYPFTELRLNNYDRIDFESSKIRKYWQPTFAIDYWNFPNKDTFITQHSSLNGMSGGPVFDIKGNVCGMDISHMIRKVEITNQKNFVSKNGVVITVEELKKAKSNLVSNGVVITVEELKKAIEKVTKNN